MFEEHNDNIKQLHKSAVALERTFLGWLVDDFEKFFDLFFLTNFNRTLTITCQKLEIKQMSPVLRYMVDLFLKLNEVQNRLQGRGATLIEACAILLVFLKKLSLYKYFLR